MSSLDLELLDAGAKQVREWADGYGALTNISDNSSKEGIDWQIDIRRDDASRFAADATLVGNTLPDDSNEEVDIIVRYPEEKRDIGKFDQLRVKTALGMVPITNFASN